MKFGLKVKAATLVTVRQRYVNLQMQLLQLHSFTFLSATFCYDEWWIMRQRTTKRQVVEQLMLTLSSRRFSSCRSASETSVVDCFDSDLMHSDCQINLMIESFLRSFVICFNFGFC